MTPVTMELMIEKDVQEHLSKALVEYRKVQIKNLESMVANISDTNKNLAKLGYGEGQFSAEELALGLTARIEETKSRLNENLRVYGDELVVLVEIMNQLEG